MRSRLPEVKVGESERAAGDARAARLSEARDSRRPKIAMSRLDIIDDLTLFRSGNRFETLTGSETLDSVTVAVSLFLSSLLIRSLVTRVWVNLPLVGARCGVGGQDTRSYHQVCRLASINQISKLEGIWSKESFPVDDATATRYSERNVRSRLTTKCIGLFLLAMEFVFIAIALPTGSESVRPADNMVRLAIRTPQNATRALLRTETCKAGNFVEMPFVANKGEWNFCNTISPGASGTELEPGRAMFLIGPDLVDEAMIGISAGFYYGDKVMQMRWAGELRVTPELPAFVEILAESVDAVHEAMRTNLEMVGDAEGFSVEDDLVDDHWIGFVLNFEDLRANEPEGAESSLTVILQTAVTGVLEFNNGGAKSRLFLAHSSDDLTLTEYTGNVLIGTRTGPMVTALGSVIATAAAFAAWILARVVFGRFPILNWEIREAHSRLCCDALMAGPDDVRVLEKSVDPLGIGHVGYGLKPAHDRVDTFLKGQVVESR